MQMTLQGPPPNSLSQTSNPPVHPQSLGKLKKDVSPELHRASQVIGPDFHGGNNAGVAESRRVETAGNCIILSTELDGISNEVVRARDVGLNTDTRGQHESGTATPDLDECGWPAEACDREKWANPVLASVTCSKLAIAAMMSKNGPDSDIEV